MAGGPRRRYRYVGPAELSDEVRPGGEAVVIGCQADLDRWLKGRGGVQDLDEPFTFVVGLDGLLRLAPRRSEHVACAGGRDVLAAGEVRFAGTAGEWSVAQVSNQSTGYCPDPDCWPAVAGALERAGLPHPGDFTDKLLFRRCPGCGERNVVKDRYFFCDLCGAMLPEHWNFDCWA
ncbi:hypothetical protein [Actinomadura sp. HBU206391]|uniref:hypothetical protein n=1 Tax=Actinomadura sp. HBU206391 TaxID=2731692 RepID=UPI00164FE4F0|nr:hypothetical protein [Actinomadura sp. HBU206391]MBC6457601.1 hypothetical protein [Actinomadura sp. HBU206391]